MDFPHHASAIGRLDTSHVAPTVFVIDPDSSVRTSLEPLICHAGWRPKILKSAEEFLAQPEVSGPSCLVSDVSLPGLSGLELQAQLADRPDMPLIFLASHFDVSITVRAMKAGAMEFLTKPFSDAALLNAIGSGLDRSRIAIRQKAELRMLQERYATLTRREQEVMALVVSGLLNKQAGGHLGISELTVKVHRGKVMRKMGVRSFAHLVNVAAQLEVARPSLAPGWQSAPSQSSLSIDTIIQSALLHSFDATPVVRA